MISNIRNNHSIDIKNSGKYIVNNAHPDSIQISKRDTCHRVKVRSSEALNFSFGAAFFIFIFIR